MGVSELGTLDREVSFGSYRADILARDPRDDSTVLIENQLEHANLQHLGQVLTYLAGLKADTVVWIAKDFGEGHLSAIRWLTFLEIDTSDRANWDRMADWLHKRRVIYERVLTENSS